MAVKVVGKQNVDFKNDKGEKIEGVKLHLVGDDPHVTGKAVFTQFFKSGTSLYSQAVQLPNESEVVLVYDRKGKVDDIIIKK